MKKLINLEKILDEFGWNNVTVHKPDIIKAMKEACSQAIDLCVENAECIDEGTYGRNRESIDCYEINKFSILKTKNQIE